MKTYVACFMHRPTLRVFALAAWLALCVATEGVAGSERMGRLFDGVHASIPGSGFVTGQLDADPAVDAVVGQGHQLILWGATPEGVFAQDGSITLAEPLVPVALGRMNADSYPDLVGRTGTGLGIVHGTATGLGSSLQLLSVTAPDEFVLGDMDGDGLDDFVCGTDDSIRVLLNRGDHLEAVASPAASDTWLNFAVGDFDGDGTLDAVASGFHAGTYASFVRTYRGVGGGHMTPWFEFVSPTFVDQFETRDMDADGHVDIVANGYDPSILWNDGAGTFSDRLRLPEYVYSGRLAIGDIDGNGSVDIAVTDYWNDRVWARPYLNRGSRLFDKGAECFAGGRQNGKPFPVIGDFDADGLPDIVVHNSVGQPFVVLFRGRAGGTLNQRAHEVDLPSFQTPYAVDFFGGSRDAVLLVTTDSALYFDTGIDGSLQSPVPVPDAAGVAPLELSGDGRADLVRSENGEVQIRKCLGGLVFASPETVRFGNLRTTADFNGDGVTDLLVGDVNGVRVVPGLGGGSFGSPGPVLLPAHDALIHVAAADIDGDGDADLVSAEPAPRREGARNPDDYLVTYRNEGDLSFAVWQTMLRPPPERGFSSLDHIGFMNLDADGIPDLYVGYYADNELLHMARGIGDGQFAFSDTVEAFLGESQRVVFVDLEGDGQDELVVSACSSIQEGYLMIWSNDGGGYPAEPALIWLGGVTTRTAVGDFDGDGAPDLAQACHEAMVYVVCTHVTVHMNRLKTTPTPVLLSLVSSMVTSQLVRIEWYAAEAAGPVGVERREGEASWERIATLWSDRGRILFEDRDVVPGRDYSYRLAVQAGADVTYTQPFTTRIPVPSLSLRARPGRDPNRMLFVVSASSLDPIEIVVHDLQGRRVASRLHLPRAPGESSDIELSANGGMLPGIYWATARQGGSKATARIIRLF